MSVNLNILANKAIRGYANVDDIESSLNMYVSGSPYIVYAVNNDTDIPFTGIPQQATYCSASILEWSPDPTFTTGVTSSAQNCNSSSLSGSLLWYGSFANNNQSGGVLNNYEGYQVKVFDYTIPNPSVAPTTTYDGKTYYFRSVKFSDFGFTGSYSPISSSQLTKPVATQSGTNYPAEGILYRTRNLYNADGYNNVTNRWIGNIPPTIVKGAVNNEEFPVPYSGEITIATGSGFPTISKYGNLGTDVVLTKGATLTIPMTGSLSAEGVFFQICLVEGSVAGTSDVGGWSFSMNCGNSYTLPAAGSETYGTLKTTDGFYYTGLQNRNGIVSFVRDRRDDQGPHSGFPLQYRLRVNGEAIPAADSVGPVFPSTTATITLSTSTNAVLRFVAGGRSSYWTYGFWPVGADYNAGATTREQYLYYKEIYGTYTGSLSGN
jgi:hypothetical protein